MDDEPKPVTQPQWAALALVAERHAGAATTYIVATPAGDAAISRVSAKALLARGFITIDEAGQRAWPTEGGLRALATHTRIQQRSTPPT